MGLLFRPDFDEARRWLTAWWNGADMGRPALLLTAPSPEPLDDVEEMPEPEGWVTHYSTSDFGYRVNLGLRAHVNTLHMAESIPTVSPDLAPNCLALYLGCHGVEMPGTTWCEPCFERPEEARFEFDPDNFYWDFTLRLTREFLRLGKGKFLQQFPDLIEGLDTLGAMRGSDKLLLDLIERPDWVQSCMRQVTDRYFQYYDILYDLMRDDMGGSVFWAWAPGRMVKLQCDFSAMISPDMFGEIMVPVLDEMTQRISYSMYHWDGPGALPHHDHLLSLENLDMLQWTPGAGHEPADDARWWPYYHKTVEAGKKLYVTGCRDIAHLKRMRKEFGAKLNQFLIAFHGKSVEQAEAFVDAASA